MNTNNSVVKKRGKKKKTSKSVKQIGERVWSRGNLDKLFDIAAVLVALNTILFQISKTVIRALNENTQTL